MSLLLQIIVIYIKENIITKLQKLYSSPRNSRAGNKSPALFVEKPHCTGDLLPARKILIEKPANPNPGGFKSATAPLTEKEPLTLEKDKGDESKYYLSYPKPPVLDMNREYRDINVAEWGNIPDSPPLLSGH